MAGFHNGLIFIGLQTESVEELLELLCQGLIEGGFVRPAYTEAVLRREREYPSGLPAKLPLAIPHAGGEQVIRPAIAIARLSKPLAFGSMSNPSVKLDVSLVFLLALNDPQEQLATLKTLMDTIQNERGMKALQEAADTSDFIDILRSMGWRRES